MFYFILSKIFKSTCLPVRFFFFRQSETTSGLTIHKDAGYFCSFIQHKYCISIEYAIDLMLPSMNKAVRHCSKDLIFNEGRMHRGNYSTL